MSGTEIDRRWMRHALKLAARGPIADANPRVGCVVTAGDELVGAGWHDGTGSPHAEGMALAQAGRRANGATAYVTLEPCAHWSRTPPCAQALIDAGIARVVIAVTDPNPTASGGTHALQTSGIAVTLGVCTSEAADVNRRWLTSMRLGRPWVTWKFAASLDGRSASADGTSQWITSPAARADVGRLRAQHQAIVAGASTVVADDPHLTARAADGTLLGSQPVRVVVGDRELGDSWRVFDDAAETVHLRTRDPHGVLAALFARGVRSVWLEGGPTLATAWWRAGVVDEVVAYLAPLLLGAGTAAVRDLGIATLADALRWSFVDCQPVGADVRLVMRRG